MKLNETERIVLSILAGAYSSYDGFCCLSFAGILEDKRCGPLATRRAVRLACRSLARKGLAQYQRGLWREDGEMAGAGYGVTRAGAELVSTFDE